VVVDLGIIGLLVQVIEQVRLEDLALGQAELVAVVVVAPDLVEVAEVAQELMPHLHLAMHFPELVDKAVLIVDHFHHHPVDPLMLLLFMEELLVLELVGEINQDKMVEQEFKNLHNKVRPWFLLQSPMSLLQMARR
jgi:hypothetical protein